MASSCKWPIGIACPPVAHWPWIVTRFAATVTAALKSHPLVSVEEGEITALPDDGHWIIATGPLTSEGLGQAIAEETGAEALAFFDAIAPIVYHDSIDMTRAWMQSRYDKGETEQERTAYLNCPMNRDQYEAFIDALLAADKTEFHEGETAGYFDGCLPDRGDGRARSRNVAPRPDEARWPDQSACSPMTNPMRWCSCAGTTRLARFTTS